LSLEQSMHSFAVRRAFSLIELVIVVVIIGIIGAIAIPRMSRGAAGAADSALAGNLAVLRNSIDLFQTEHGGLFPTQVKFSDQLTLFSDDAGNVMSTKDSTFIFGPYLRAIPPLPVGANKGATGVNATAGSGIGWIYDDTTGAIRASTTGSEVDARGVLYSAY